MSEIRNNPTVKAALQVVTEHAEQIDKSLDLNNTERHHDPFTQSIKDSFAALDQARVDKAASVSAEGVGTGNPLVNPHDLYS